MQELYALFEALYRYLILPIFAGIWWVIRKISFIEQEIMVMKRETEARQDVFRAEVKLLEAKIQGQIDISSAHHTTTQQQQATMMAKLESIEAFLRGLRQ